jgi:hypothetical protein
MCVAAAARAQDAAALAEKEAVRKVVETYLYAEETDEKKGTLLGDAQIVFLNADGKQTRVTSVSKGGKGKSGGKISRGTQRVVAVDVINDGASVKVETELMPDGPSTLKHCQYLWLLKTDAGWKIAGILMPGTRPPRPASK